MYEQKTIFPYLTRTSTFFMEKWITFFRRRRKCTSFTVQQTVLGWHFRFCFGISRTNYTFYEVLRTYIGYVRVTSEVSRKRYDFTSVRIQRSRETVSKMASEVKAGESSALSPNPVYYEVSPRTVSTFQYFCGEIGEYKA